MKPETDEMFSCIGKKKPSKRFQAVSKKVKEYYKIFHSINSELKEITEHKAVITDPNQYKRWILNYFKLFHKQITKVVKNQNFQKESVVNSFETIQKWFQDIYEKLLALQPDIDELFEHL